MTHTFRFVVAIAIAILSTSLLGGVYVKFDAQGGVFAVPGVTMENGSIPDEVITAKGYADPVRIGYNFAGWSSIANPKDETELEQGFVAYYANPVTKVTTFYAIWNPADPFCNDSNGVWTVQDGVLCGCLTGEAPSSCSFEIPGRGWISFKWRVVDWGQRILATQGQEYSFYDGNRLKRGYAFYPRQDVDDGDGWQMARIAITDGEPADFSWELNPLYNICVFCGTGPGAKVQITDIAWKPADDFVSLVQLETCGGSLPTNAVERIGQYGELPTPVRDGCEFLGWMENRPYEQGYVYNPITQDTWLPLSSNVTIYAAWNVPKEVAADPDATIDGGIEFAEGDWSVRNQWNYVSEYDENGQWIVLREIWAGEYLHWSRSLTIGRNFSESIPFLSATVTGCGVYHFQELCCCDSNLRMAVFVDGKMWHEVQAPYTPNTFDLEIREGGEHRVEVVLRVNVKEWRDDGYDSQMGSYMNISASAAIESMSWRTPDQINVNFDSRGGLLDGPSVRTYAPGYAYWTLPTVSRDKFRFLGWFTEPGGGDCVRTTELVRLMETNLYARWSTDLKTAIGGGKLRFASKGEWEGTSDFCHGDGYASAAATDINWGETNVMTTVVQGEGLLTFWWLQGDDFSSFVSAMPMQDSFPAELSLWLDGRCVALCADYASWKHMTLPVLGRGNHIVEWKYTPGGSSTAMPLMMFDGYGRWRSALAQWRSTGTWQKETSVFGEFITREPHVPGAWVDEVAWTPAGEVRDIVAWAKGIAEGRGWLTNVLPLIEAEYSAQIAANPANYEPVVLRAFTKLAKLGENENLKALIAKFGFVFDYQVLGNFFGELDYFDAPLSNDVIDQVVAELRPAIESALADFELIPRDWTGSIPVSPDVYPVSAIVYVDLADVTLCKAALKGALSALAIAESYDLSVDYMNIEMEAILQHAGLPMTFEYFVEDHPDFLKRVRDAERLAEGKEILRDALETLQAFDELMVARSTVEMHFFEYNAKDAEKQQYAREEVAKMLAALDGEVEINNEDFRYASNFRIENLKQPATLVPFFAGELTRRYLPTEINGNILVFDSFPSMAFGGMFPGLTKDIVAGWLAAYGHEVEYTPNSDYEPEVRFRTFSAAIPKLGVSATEEEIKDALAGTADEKIRENVRNSTSYAAFETWATKVQSSGVSLKAVKASPYSWQSFALAAPELMQKEIADEDLKVEEFKPSAESGKFDFTVSVKDVTVGSEAVEENLKQIFGLQGTDSLDAAFKSENVDIQFAQPENGKLKFTAEPKNKGARSFFMKMSVK